MWLGPGAMSLPQPHRRGGVALPHHLLPQPSLWEMNWTHEGDAWGTSSHAVPGNYTPRGDSFKMQREILKPKAYVKTNFVTNCFSGVRGAGLRNTQLSRKMQEPRQ